MEMFEQLTEVVNDKNDFKTFIDKQKENDSEFLHRTFWHKDGEQLTILNQLIELHEKNQDTSWHIRHLLKQGVNSEINQSIHRALSLGKRDLAEILFQNRVGQHDHLPENLKLKAGKAVRRVKDTVKHALSMDRNTDPRDIKGRTLLSLALETDGCVLLAQEHKEETDEDVCYLEWVLGANPNIDEPNQIAINADEHLHMQPFHQAVFVNSPKAIKLLHARNAQLDNPCGVDKETPLLLAARFGCIDAMKTLFELSTEIGLKANVIDANAKNLKSETAIDLLCKRINNQTGTAEALRGIAILLCHKAPVPQNEQFQNLLRKHRDTLVKEVGDYTASIKDEKLRAKFVRSCHDKNHPLSDIMYSNNSWLSFFSDLMGKPGETAFSLENLVTQSDAETDEVASPTIFRKDEQLFADFVRRYNRALKSTMFFNPFSEMRWKLARGEITCWQQVKDYAQEHQSSRTKLLIDEMTIPKSSVHEDIGTSNLPS